MADATLQGVPVRTAESAAPAAPSAARSVRGGVRTLLRVEGLAVLAVSAAAYAQWGAGWMVFAGFFLLPDLSMLGYSWGPRVGAASYNAGHSYIGPLALLAFGAFAAVPLAVALALIWTAHLGFDRALGYGLKYQTAFGATHLGRIGPQDPW